MICPFCNSNSVERVDHQEMRHAAFGTTRWQCQNCGRLVNPALSPSFEILQLPLSELQDRISFELASGHEVAWDKVARVLRAIVDMEDKTMPLTDEELATELSLHTGLDYSTQAVLKFRETLGIPGAAGRRDESAGGGA